MWQIMWMLSLLPDWFWHLALIGSIVAIVMGKTNPPMRWGGVAGLLFCIWMEGGISNEAKWQARVAEMEAKVAKAEQEAKDANEKLDKKSQQKVKVIREKGIVIRQYIDREVTKYDETCKIPKEVVKAHNAAAKNEAVK